MRAATTLVAALATALVYGLGFAGQEQSPEGKGFRARFLGNLDDASSQPVSHQLCSPVG